MEKKLKIVFAGTPEIAALVLTTMLNEGYSPQLVLTQPDRPAGRGLKLTPSAVKLVASQHAIEVCQPLSFKQDPQLITKLRTLNPDLIVVVAYGLIVPPAVLAIPRLGCINIHVSLLPRWRGAAPIQRALLAGDSRTGVSLMQMDAGLDTGPVLMTEEIAIEDNDTSASLHAKLANLGAALLIKFLMQPKAYVPVNQPVVGVSYAHKLTKAEAQIDWQQSALEIERKIRGYNPFPGAFTYLAGDLVKIWQATVGATGPSLAKAGTIIAVTNDSLHIVCGDASILVVTEIQEAGARRKPVSQYVQAQPNLLYRQFDEKTSEKRHE